MLYKTIRFGAVAALACFALASLSAPASAQKKHDSNTLHKLGNAIQYPVRKAGENTSIAAHRAVGNKSVVHRRNGNKTYRAVVTPNGDIHRKYRVGHRRHRNYAMGGKKYYTYNGHHYYMDRATGQRHMVR